MRSMRALEDRYGSLEAVNTEVQTLLADEAAKPFSTLLPLVAAGLLHEGIDEDTLADALTPARFFEVRSVLVDAINQSFPDTGKAEASPEQEPAPASPGTSSTTTPPSPLVGATAGSGA